MRGQSRGAAATLSQHHARTRGIPPRDPVGASPTLQLLVDCVSAHRLAEARSRLHHRLEGPIDWAGVVRLAHQHAVTPLVYRELRQVPAALVPPETLAALHQNVRENARRCLLLTGWLRRVVDALAAAGVPAIPYKGPVLAAVAYGSIADRRAGDLDLLIDPRDLSAAKAALDREGFRPIVPLVGWQERTLVRSAHPYGFVRDRENVVVELHWSVSPRSLSAGLGGALPPERLAEVVLAGTTFRTLPADVLLLALCVHGAKHVWERLVLDRGHRGADRVSPRPRLGGGARTRRRGGPRA